MSTSTSADAPRVPPGAPPPAPAAAPEAAAIGLGQVLLVALAVGVFSVLWLASYTRLDALIWQNPFVTANRWTIPVGALFFSLLVGLAQRYLRAPNVIHGGGTEVLLEGDFTGYQTFWGALVSSYASLFSGASVGPEGPLGVLAVDLAEWLGRRLRVPQGGMLAAGLAAMSAAYNGIVGSPVFAAVFASEQLAGRGGLRLLAVNLAAGAVGYLLFALLRVPPFAGFLALDQPDALSPGLVLWALALGAAGAVVAAYIGIAFRVFGRLMGAFGDRVVARALVAGAVVGVVGLVVPDLLFSGEASIHAIMADPAAVGLGMLVLMALAKPLLLALACKSGYLGGPVFPTLFTAVMVGLAVSLVAPRVPLAVLVTCVEVGAVTLVLKAPLTSILLVAVVAQAGPHLTGLITVAAVTAMLLGGALQGLQARRAGATAAAPVTPDAG
jgi:H+/Cl- antiporter ClcA